MKLMGAHALLACTEQVIRQQPFTQGNVAVGEDRTHGDCELFAASGAFPYALANVLAFLRRLRRQAIGVIKFATMRTDWAIWPAKLFQELPRLIFVAKVLSQRD